MKPIHVEITHGATKPHVLVFQLARGRDSRMHPVPILDTFLTTGSGHSQFDTIDQLLAAVGHELVRYFDRPSVRAQSEELF